MSLIHEVLGTKPLDIPKIRELNLTDTVYNEMVDDKLWTGIQRCLDLYKGPWSKHNSETTWDDIELALDKLGLGNYVRIDNEGYANGHYSLVAKDGFSFQTITTERVGNKNPGTRVVVRKVTPKT